ncbi:MAG: hypothetical protein CMI36_10735 [Owenweeksia sp.]|nr:hypothetical protein [Owenweeksia sp.]MBF99457.1 hypothetical protein [Owenweeksia sp.]HBF19967.1 hypothetical protein [Cryomorphaceae bacterium]|tara:strand:+ start:3113 stop:4057 length:945 start_codon:yes stop_codon:yes gene_type:complete
MKFSVIIPLYNKEKHIAEAIESVLSQTVPDFEIIIVDNGSSDNSLHIAKTYERPGVKVVTQLERKGVSSARNTGIEASSYDHLCFLDADDYWFEDFLQNISELIEAFPQAGIYTTAIQFKRKDTLYHPGYYGLPQAPAKLIVPDYFESILHGEQVITASSVCIPKHILNETGPFDEQVRDGEDQELWNRIALKYPVAFHRSASAVYRQDADNMITHQVPKRELDHAVKLQKMLDEGHIPDIRKDIIQKIIAANLIGVASMNILAGDKAMARLLLNDPRSKKLPQRRSYWVLLLALPNFLVRILYALRRKLLNKR